MIEWNGREYRCPLEVAIGLLFTEITAATRLSFGLKLAHLSVKRRRSPDNLSEQNLLDLTTPNRAICNSATLGMISIHQSL